MRVVSLVPSATEILLALTGASAFSNSAPIQLVGKSHECDWPDSPPSSLHTSRLSDLPALTSARDPAFFANSTPSPADIDAHVRELSNSGQSLYTLDQTLLAQLSPDLIITQDLCHVCSIDLASVRRVAQSLHPSPRILSCNPQSFEGVLDDILAIGDAVGLQRQALDLVVRLRERMDRAAEYINPYADSINVAFIEWTDPLFVAGHWTPQLIERAGGYCPLNPTRALTSAGAAAGPIGQSLRTAGPSIAITPQQLLDSHPQALIICPCGVGISQAIPQAQTLLNQPWFAPIAQSCQGKIALVDGNHMFSRPGPRLVDAFEFLAGWLNQRPDIIPKDFPWQPLP